MNYKFRIFKKLSIAIVALITVLVCYTWVMGKIGHGEAPEALPHEQQADAIEVRKGERKMFLLRQGKIIATYHISLGRHADDGPKQREGDEKTPEGNYVIDWRNSRSKAYLSLHISYPSPSDELAAKTNGYSAGGNIMVHGLLNGWGWLAPIHNLWDWTDGCIGVTNAEMHDIWSKVPDGTPIHIQP